MELDSSSVAEATASTLLEDSVAALATVVACALGYRAASDKYASLAKVRYEAKEVIQHI